MKLSRPTYVAEFRALAKHCNFGETLDVMIRNRLVCGINDDSIQKRLLTEGDKLSLTKAISIAQSYKMAEKDATELLPQDADLQPVYRVQPAPATGAPSKKCYRCAKAGHWPSACCFKKERCRNCNKVGHIKRACTAPPKGTLVRNVQLGSKSDTTNTNSTTVVGYEYPLFTVTASQTPPIVISVTINDKQIQMELDTGAAVSLVSEGTYRISCIGQNNSCNSLVIS